MNTQVLPAALLAVYAVPGIVLVALAFALINRTLDRRRRPRAYPVDDDFRLDLPEYYVPLVALQKHGEALRVAINEIRSKIQQIQDTPAPHLGRWDKMCLWLRQNLPRVRYIVLFVVGEAVIASALVLTAVSVWALIKRLLNQPLSVVPVVVPGTEDAWRLFGTVLIVCLAVIALLLLAWVVSNLGSSQVDRSEKWLYQRNITIPLLEAREHRLYEQRRAIVDEFSEAIDMQRKILVTALKEFHGRPGAGRDFI